MTVAVVAVDVVEALIDRVLLVELIVRNLEHGDWLSLATDGSQFVATVAVVMVRCCTVINKITCTKHSNESENLQQQSIADTHEEAITYWSLS